MSGVLCKKDLPIKWYDLVIAYDLVMALGVEVTFSFCVGQLF